MVLLSISRHRKGIDAGIFRMRPNELHKGNPNMFPNWDQSPNRTIPAAAGRIGIKAGCAGRAFR